MCMLLYRLARPIYLKILYLKAHRTPAPCLSRVGFCHGERHRVGAGAVWCGVGALVAARRASCRVGPSIPHGRPQGPHTQSPRLRPRIHATPAPPRGGISAPQKPTPERGAVVGSLPDTFFLKEVTKRKYGEKTKPS